jgi:hypothetical protein
LAQRLFAYDRIQAVNLFGSPKFNHYTTDRLKWNRPDFFWCA